jgi:hypothetical protein
MGLKTLTPENAMAYYVKQEDRKATNKGQNVL